MHNRFGHRQGFTIVELLIVIVVIAILAAISIVAFTGIQSRARDSQRLNDAKQIIRALESHRAIHGTYPASGPNTDSNNTCGVSHTNGYSYSTSTNGRWMPGLVASGEVSNMPTAPGNDCNSYYRYLRRAGTSYGCASRTNGYAVLQVYGVEGMATPSDAAERGQTWRPCVGATTGWGSGDTHWTFILEE